MEKQIEGKYKTIILSLTSMILGFVGLLFTYKFIECCVAVWHFEFCSEYFLYDSTADSLSCLIAPLSIAGLVVGAVGGMW